MSLKHWLEANEPGKYVEVFADNDVDLQASCLLTDPELENPGVSLGRHKQLRTVCFTYLFSGQMHP